jgi:hypothetical protein
MKHVQKYRLYTSKIPAGRLEGKKPFARPRRRWEGDIKMYLRYVSINVCFIEVTLDISVLMLQ